VAAANKAAGSDSAGAAAGLGTTTGGTVAAANKAVGSADAGGAVVLTLPGPWPPGALDNATSSVAGDSVIGIATGATAGEEMDDTVDAGEAAGVSMEDGLTTVVVVAGTTATDMPANGRTEA